MRLRRLDEHKSKTQDLELLTGLGSARKNIEENEEEVKIQRIEE